jgi:integrase
VPRKRRGRGEGSIYQRDDDLWVGSVSLGYNTSGKRDRRVTYGKTKTEVQQKLADLAKAERPIADAARIAVGEFLTNWVATKVRRNAAPTTHRRYEQVVRLHLLPYIGHIPLAKLGRLHFQQLFTRQEEAKLSTRNRSMAATVLHTALAYAASDDARLLSLNPTAGLKDKPRHEYQPDTMHHWTAEEAKLFLKSAADSRYYALYAMAIGTGMRQGELFALTWRDIDFDNAAVTVTRRWRSCRARCESSRLRQRRAVGALTYRSSW